MNNLRQIVTLHTLVHIDIILCIILISYLDHIVYILSQELQFGCVPLLSLQHAEATAAVEDRSHEFLRYVRSKKASFLMPETENNVHSLSLRGQNKAIASCMYSHWSEASPQWSS